MLKYSINQLKNTVHEILLTIPAEEIQQQVSNELEQLRKKASIPGFRKGKAPLKVVRARYGKNVEEDARFEVTNRNFKKIMEQESYKVVGGGAIKTYNKQDDGSLAVVLEFQIEPEIKLKKIDKLSVSKEIHIVNDENVDKTMENLRDQHAVIEPVEGEANENHYIMADFQEIDISGSPIIGHKFEDRYFMLGSKVFGEKFEDQMNGSKVGDVRNVEVTYPHKDSPDAKKTEFYQVTIKRIENKNLPDLDDEFALSISDYESIDDLRKSVRENLQRELDYRSKDQMHSELIDEVIKNNPFDVPPLMADFYLHTWFEDIKKDSKQKLDEEQLKEQNRPFAIRNIKWHLLRRKIVEQENISVSDENVESFIKDISDKTKTDSTEVKKYYQTTERKEKLKEQILDNLIFERLLKTAKIKEVIIKDNKSKLIETA